jgi:hypothetical protein
MLGIVAVGGYAAVYDLQQELSVLAELEDCRRASPLPVKNIVISVDGDAVLAAPRTSVAVGAPLGRVQDALRERRCGPRIEPLVSAAFGRAAPSLDAGPSAGVRGRAEPAIRF